MLGVKTKRTITYYAVAVAVFALAGVLLYFDDKIQNSFIRQAFGYIAQMLMMGLALVWAVLINSRIVQKSIRSSLMSATFFLLLWLIIRYVKYNFFEYDDAVQRYLWYAFYIPQTLVPPIMLIAALNIGRSDERHFDRRLLTLFIPSVIFLALIFTNDFHQTAFGFKEDFSNWRSGYSHGITYYLTMIYSIGLIIVSLAVIFHKCRVSACHKLLWVPLVILLGGMALTISSFLGLVKSYRIPELFCLTFAAVFESCIQIGLIPSNSRYGEFFNKSGLSAVVVNGENSIIYRSEALVEISNKSIEASEQGSVDIAENIRLNAADIHGGRVLWTDDLTVINQINARIASIGEQLSEENEIIAAENKLKEERAAVEEQNMLYDGVANAVSKQLKRSAELLDGLKAKSPDFNIKMGNIAILNAYVKRRSNLEIIAAKEEQIGSKELGYSIRESLDYISLVGVSCSFGASGEAKFSASEIKLCYEFFEEVIERALPSLSALMVNLNAEGDVLELRITSDGASDVLTENWNASELSKRFGAVEIMREDDTVYQTLSFGNGARAKESAV